MALLQVLVGGAAALSLVPVIVLFVEIIAAVSSHTRRKPSLTVNQRVAVIVPAHNEEIEIESSLRSVLPQLGAADRLIVVADNCTDKTYAVAAAAGAEVITRTDPHHRGKGYALDFGIRHLRSNPPDIVIVMDADCHLADGAISRLTQFCAETRTPVQALYLMRAGNGAKTKMRIAEFAWLVKNLVRPLGLKTLGLPCQLMGTGMAFPWENIRTANLATGHIVEDLKLGIELARGGAPAQFCPDALVTSEFPSSAEGVRGQRTRWEHGHLTLICREAPRLFIASIASLDKNLLALALDLSVPPLALLTMLIGTICLSALGLYILADARIPLAIASASIGLLGGSLLLSWFRFARHIVSLGALFVAVAYSIWKIPMYLRFIYGRQINWVRSKRDGEDA